MTQVARQLSRKKRHPKSKGDARFCLRCALFTGGRRQIVGVVGTMNEKMKRRESYKILILLGNVTLLSNSIINKIANVFLIAAYEYIVFHQHLER